MSNVPVFVREKGERFMCVNVEDGEGVYTKLGKKMDCRCEDENGNIRKFPTMVRTTDAPPKKIKKKTESKKDSEDLKDAETNIYVNKVTESE